MFKKILKLWKQPLPVLDKVKLNPPVFILNILPISSFSARQMAQLASVF